MAWNFSEISPWFSSGTIAANYTSIPFRVCDFDRFAIQYNMTGSLAGSIKLLASIDGLNYVEIPDSSFNIISPNVYLVSVTSFAYRYIKAELTVSSGVGEIVSTVNTVNFK